MPIIRRKLDPSTVYPEDIQYDPGTDKVQRKVNGSWVDAPESDPRTHTTFPPRITSDPACDAAESVKDAFKGQIDQIITAITNASTAFTIAGLILGLFSFGVFAIFISIALTIADGMIGAGASALTAALTDPVWHTFACILNCHMDSQGRLRVGELGAVIADIDDQIGGLGSTILDALVLLAGEGGINNLGAIGTSTGDCDDCGCACDEATTGSNGGSNGIVVYLGDNTYQLTGTAASFEGHPFTECAFSLGGVGFCYAIKSIDYMSVDYLRSGVPYQILCNGTDVGFAGHDPNRCLQVCAFGTNLDDTRAFTIKIHVCPCT